MRVLLQLTSLLVPLLGLITPGVEAQSPSGDSWFPDQGYFATPYASTREPVFALRALWSPVFRGRSDPAERPPFDFQGQEGLDTELQGEAALGGTFRLWSPAQWGDGGLTLGIQAGVFGRFRLEVSSSDLVASDWVVAFPVEAGWGPWSARVRLTHWSAHLGDEVIESGASPGALVEERGLAQVSDRGAVEAAVRRAMELQAKAVEDFRAGNEKARGRIFGAAMKELRGRGDPARVTEVLSDLLG